MFESNGGSCATVMRDYKAGVPYGSLPEPRREGWSFAGWWTSSSGGEQVRGCSVVTPVTTRTLYAHWTKGGQRVCFNANGGTCSIHESIFQIGGTYTNLPNATQTGRIFTGWATGASGGEWVAEGSLVTGASARMFYAQWNAGTQKVTFDANGGNCAVATAEYSMGDGSMYSYGSYRDLPEATRDGYVFDGWWTKSEGGLLVEEENGVSSDTERTLYAHWKTGVQMVMFNANSGNCSMETKLYAMGGKYMNLPTATRAEYLFAGWWTSASGGMQVTTSSMVTADSVRPLYAHWTPEKQTVTLDLQGGTGGSTNVTATYGSAMPKITVPQKTGYTFGGYFALGGTQYYKADGTSAHVWDQMVDAKLYAKWTVATYNVTLDFQGGTEGTANVTATYSSAMPKITVPKKEGYTFGGYFALGGTQYYKADGTSAHVWDQMVDAKLYAKWTVATYNVTLDFQGGTEGTANVTATYSSAMPKITVPKKEGYVFGGYFILDGTQYYFANGSSARTWDLTAATKLYAKWTAATYSVTLDLQGGTGGTTNVTATYGSAMPKITVPKKDGNTFGGYFALGGAQYYKADGTSAHVWNQTVDANLYAKWTVATYNVTLDLQGGTGGTTNVTVTYGSAMPKITVPKKEGYVFGGYFILDGTQYYFANGSSARTWNLTAATKLYAKWTVATYNVTLDLQGGTGGTTNVTVTYGSAMPKITVPKKDVNTFGGYFALGGTQYYKADGTSAHVWNLTADAKLYAKWTPAQDSDPSRGPAISDMKFGASGRPSCILFSGVEGTEYEMQWTPSLLEGWITQTRWTAVSGAETEIPVTVPDDAQRGFFRIVTVTESGLAGTE